MRLGVDNHIKSDTKLQTVVPSRFKRSSQQQRGRANRALRPGAPANLLFKVLPEPYLYSLDNDHLQIPVELAQHEMIYQQLVLDVWLKKIRQEIRPPYFYKFEVGKEGFKELLKVHLLANGDAGLLDVSRDGEVIKPFRVGTEKTLMSYLYKPPVPFSLKALRVYEEALLRVGKQGKALPKVSGYIFSKSSF